MEWRAGLWIAESGFQSVGKDCMRVSWLSCSCSCLSFWKTTSSWSNRFVLVSAEFHLQLAED